MAVVMTVVMVMAVVMAVVVRAVRMYRVKLFAPAHGRRNRLPQWPRCRLTRAIDQSQQCNW